MGATRGVLPLVLALALAPLAQPQSYVSDPASPELLELAKPLKIDESKYGCGPVFDTYPYYGPMGEGSAWPVFPGFCEKGKYNPDLSSKSGRAPLTNATHDS